MEIDVKKEQERVQGEIKGYTEQINQITIEINLLQQRQQELVNETLKRQGELALLQRLDGNKGKGEKDT